MFPAEKSEHTLLHPNFRGVPLGLDCRCCGSSYIAIFVPKATPSKRNQTF